MVEQPAVNRLVVGSSPTCRVLSHRWTEADNHGFRKRGAHPVDHQVGLWTGVRDYSTGELKHNVVALAKAAKALKLPDILKDNARLEAGAVYAAMDMPWAKLVGQIDQACGK